MDDLLVSSAVQGVGMVIIYFPICWLGLRKKLNLNKLSESREGVGAGLEVDESSGAEGE